MRCGGFLQVRNGAGHAGTQALPHAEERVAGSDQHAANRDGADDEAPYRSGLACPESRVGSGASGYELRDEGRSAEEEDQRNQQSPGDDAAGEVQRCQARADDVSDAEIGGADGGRGDRGHGAGGQLRRRHRAAHAHEAGAQVADIHDEIFAGVEQVELAQQVHESAESHVAEKNFGGAAALLSGDVDLRRGDRFREGKLGVFDHHAPQQGHEQNAQRAADQHQDRRFPVGMLEVEHRPRARDHERRNGEDRARGDRFANRSDGSGDVLFEDRALHDAQHGHADDGCGIRRSDGHAGAQAEVGVGRAQDDGHDQAEQNGADGELRHGGVFRNVGPERLFRRRR